MLRLLSIRKNILLLVLTPTILVSLILSVYFVLDRIETLETAQLNKGKVIISSLTIITQSFTLENKNQLQLQLSQFRDSEPDILAIAILASNNNLIIKSGADNFLKQMSTDHFPKEFEQHISKDLLHIISPLLLSQSSESFYFSLVLDRRPLILESHHTIFMASIFSLSILALSLYFALYMSRTFGKPLQRIAEELQAIKEGKQDVKLHIPDIPELAKISHTINDLTNSLQLAKENMQHNIDQATADLTQTLETIEIQNIELDMARKQAIQASRVKSEFLANISHEIRTPMNGVIGFTNLLLNSNIDDTQKDYLSTIRNSANNLLCIIEDILDFSKIEAGKMTFDQISYSLRECAEEVMTMLSPSSAKKNIELIPLIYNNVPEQLLGDPVRIRQILTNLLSNAIKFTEQGSIVVRIVLEDEDEDEDNESQLIRITITDTGIGMTDEQINKLFKPFSQLNQRINRHHSGTGLGLVICKKLVEQMGGEINVESKSNEGTSFSFTLRSQKLLQKNVMLPLLDFLAGQAVLLFDPHPMTLLAMKQLLSGWDMDVHDFQSLDKLMAEVKRLSQQDKFNPVIMLGIAEQNKSSLEAIATLCKIDNQGIFILGNSTDQSEIGKLLEIGVSQYLKKPLTRKQLKKTFKEVGLINIDSPSVQTIGQKTHQFSQLRILAVDDHPSNLKLITIILEEMSIDVIQAYDGLSAVEICKEETFDLIFMDIRMPGIDGIEATQRIRNHGLNKNTPIIALTAHAMAGEKEQLLAKGLEDYMMKPVDTDQLQQIISRWTGQAAQIEQKQLSAGTLYEPESPDLQSIDWNSCLHICGGRDNIAREMLADLVSAIPEFQQQLSYGQSNDKDQELLANVHKLHGIACYTGVPQLKSLAAKLEQQLKTNATAPEVVPLQSAVLNELSKIEEDAASYLSD